MRTVCEVTSGDGQKMTHIEFIADEIDYLEEVIKDDLMNNYVNDEKSKKHADFYQEFVNIIAKR